MKLPSRKVALLIALVTLLLLVVVRSKPAGPVPADRSTASPRGGEAPRPAPARFGRKGEAPTSPDEVPDIDTSAFSPQSRGGESPARDLFKFKEPPPPKPKPAPPRPILPDEASFIGPRPLPPPPPPPVPPPISFQLAGTFGPPDSPVAVVVDGERLQLLRQGDVFDRKFIVRKIGYESVDIGFVGFAPEKTTKVGISAARK